MSIIGMNTVSMLGSSTLLAASSFNPSAALETVFPRGAMPTDAGVISQAVQQNELFSALQQGSIFLRIEKVEKAAMPRLDTVSSLRVPSHMTARDAYQAMLNLDNWNQWMPRNIFSRGTPTGRPNEQFHEAKVDGGAGGTFHYRSHLFNRDVPNGHQIYWTIDSQSRIEPDRKLKGLAINDGSWTFTDMPGEPGEILMAYQIHIEALVKGGWLGKQALKLLEPIITRMTLGEFDQVVSAMANHTVDPSWTEGSGQNPSGRTYQVKKA